MCKEESAFTRLELLAVTAGLSLLALATGSLLGASAFDSKRAICQNNLRQIGIGAHLWGSDHDDLVPWITDVRDGGTRTNNKTAIAWAEYLMFSNHIATPRVMACPADTGVKVASNWSAGAGGFANSAFRANALSYFVNIHVYPETPHAVVTGDRDFRASNPGPLSCSRGVINAAAVEQQDSQVAWTNALHAGGGHLLFWDGTAEFTSSSRLFRTLAGPERHDDGSGSLHFVKAR